MGTAVEALRLGLVTCVGMELGKVLPGFRRSTGSRARRTPGAIWSCGPSRDVDGRSSLPDSWCGTMQVRRSQDLQPTCPTSTRGPPLHCRGSVPSHVPCGSKRGSIDGARKLLREQPRRPGRTARLGWCHRDLLFWPNPQRHCTEKNCDDPQPTGIRKEGLAHSRERAECVFGGQTGHPDGAPRRGTQSVCRRPHDRKIIPARRWPQGTSALLRGCEPNRDTYNRPVLLSYAGCH